MLPARLAEAVKTYSPKTDLDTLELAYEFAKDAHHGQMRASGEPYINHPVETAITDRVRRFTQLRRAGPGR